MLRLRADGGFTLVELMVVVLIIGILVAIAIPVFNAAKANAQRKSCYANQRTLEGGAQIYLATQGTLPAAATINASANWAVPVYVKTVPYCPAVGTTGYYSLDGSGTVVGDNGAGAFTAGHQHF